MKSLVVCWAAVLLTASSSFAWAGPPVRCQLMQLAEVPVQLEGGAPVAVADINGRPVKMVLDTGAFSTMLLKSAVDALGLSAHPLDGVKVYGVGGEAGSFTTRVDRMRLGALEARDVDMFVSGHGAAGGAQGLLGQNFLLQYDLELDLPHGKVRIIKPKDCSGDQVVYWGQAYAQAPIRSLPDDDGVYVNVQVNGVAVLAELDTGADDSVLTVGAAERAGVSPATKGVTSAGAFNGLGASAVQGFVGVFPSFSFGDETIRNARLRIADLFGQDNEVTLGSRIATQALLEPQMLLGADFFRVHRVYIARSQRMVYVSYEGGPVFAPRTETPAPAAGSDAGSPQGAR